MGQIDREIKIAVTSREWMVTRCLMTAGQVIDVAHPVGSDANYVHEAAEAANRGDGSSVLSSVQMPGVVDVEVYIALGSKP